MKKFLAAGLLLTSINVFSQSYLILNNGVTLTTDKNGFVYDLGSFYLPYKVSINGGQFFVEDKNLVTVDESGLLYEKGFKVKKINGKGLNYLFNDDDDLITIDSKGFFYEFKEKIFKKVTAFGGNFFLIKPENRRPDVDLYTVNSKGNYFKITIPELNPADINYVGGTYFQTSNGSTFTVSKDGFVFLKKQFKVGVIVKAGGNFFIDSAGMIFTVSDEGFLLLPTLPANFKVNQIQKVGANYMIDSSGRLFIVTKSGTIFERSVSHDLKNTKILSI